MEYGIGAKVLDGWEIQSLIGEGAYGKVFEIHKESYGVTAVSALKVMRIPRSASQVQSALSEGMDERSVTSYFRSFVDDVVREIAIMSTLKGHPHIVCYEDHQVEEYLDEIRWDILLRMERLTSLPAYQMRGELDVAEVVRLGREIGEALAFCERKKLIHRDVKPENIFVSEFGQFKLGDFGVARTMEKTTGALSVKGTESYMAPEVYLNGKNYDHTVDIYSLGLVMYRYLNGNRLPFLPPAPEAITFADRESALMKRMKGEPLPPPRDADDRLTAIVRKACAYAPAERYQSADELVRALQAYEAGLTPAAKAKRSFRRKQERGARELRRMEPREERAKGEVQPEEPERTIGEVWVQEPQAEPEAERTVGEVWTQEPPKPVPQPEPRPEKRPEEQQPAVREGVHVPLWAEWVMLQMVYTVCEYTEMQILYGRYWYAPINIEFCFYIACFLCPVIFLACAALRFRSVDFAKRDVKQYALRFLAMLGMCICGFFGIDICWIFGLNGIGIRIPIFWASPIQTLLLFGDLVLVVRMASSAIIQRGSSKGRAAPSESDMVRRSWMRWSAAAFISLLIEIAGSSWLVDLRFDNNSVYFWNMNIIYATVMLLFPALCTICAYVLCQRRRQTEAMRDAHTLQCLAISAYALFCAGKFWLDNYSLDFFEFKAKALLAACGILMMVVGIAAVRFLYKRGERQAAGQPGAALKRG